MDWLKRIKHPYSYFLPWVSSHPTVSFDFAVTLSFVNAILFVSSLYAIPASIRALPRNHPRHITARIIAVCIVCVVTLGSFVVVADKDWGAAFSLTGADPTCNDVRTVLMCVSIVGFLFLGPMIEAVWPAEQNEQPAAFLTISTLTSWEALLPHVRDIVVAPFAEEWVFRCCTLSMLALAWVPLTTSLCICAATFALAHMHHVIEVQRQGFSLSAAILRVSVMLTYTSIFGALAGVVFWHTGSALGVSLMHSFCNLMGVPKFTFVSARGLVIRRVIVGVGYLCGIYAFWNQLNTVMGGAKATPCALDVIR